MHKSKVLNWVSETKNGMQLAQYRYGGARFAPAFFFSEFEWRVAAATAAAVHNATDARRCQPMPADASMTMAQKYILAAELWYSGMGEDDQKLKKKDEHERNEISSS